MGWSRMSASIDLEMTIRVGAPGILSSSSGKATWNENGTGSSWHTEMRYKGQEQEDWTDLWTKLVQQPFQSLSG
jgi:hypothetical protein